MTGWNVVNAKDDLVLKLIIMITMTTVKDITIKGECKDQ
jgi:hypothetical protein